MDSIPLMVAFGGGLLSFLSPCVLPLVPVYLASLAGPGIYQAEKGGFRLTLLWHSLSFVAGFTAVFTVLGAVAGITGYAVSLSTTLLNRVAGGVLIALGVFMLAALRVPRLNYEKRLSLPAGRKTGYLRSFVVGAAFTLAWTPCVAPVLGGILALASVRATVWQGAYLLAVYSLGMGIPFLVIGAAFDSVIPLLRRLQRYTGIIYLVSALLLITMGVLVLASKLRWFSSLAG